jgi:Tfp pilus assembly PilM family ATPase
MVFGSLFRPPTVGLDIGSSAVRAVSMRRGRSGWSLLAAGEVPMPDGCVEDGALTDPTLVSQTVQQLLDSMGMRRATIASALAGHAVIVKRLSLPSMSNAELAEAIPWEAEQYIPFDLADVQLDYRCSAAPMPSRPKAGTAMPPNRALKCCSSPPARNGSTTAPARLPRPAAGPSWSTSRPSPSPMPIR